MKTAFIAILFTLAATAATAQLAAPLSSGAGSTVRAKPFVEEVEPARLRADRDRVKADKARLKAARDAHDENAIRAGRATLRADLRAWRGDRERLADADTGETLNR